MAHRIERKKERNERKAERRGRGTAFITSTGCRLYNTPAAMQASKVGSILCIDQRIATLITPMLLVQYMEAYIHRNMNRLWVPPTSIHQLTDVDIQ